MSLPLLPSLPPTFSSPIRLSLLQQRQLSLHGPLILLSKPSSPHPCKILILSHDSPPVPLSSRAILLSGSLRVTFPTVALRDAFILAAHVAYQNVSPGINAYELCRKIRSAMSGEVYLVRRKIDSKLFYMKVVQKVDVCACTSRMEGLVSERAALAEAASRRDRFVVRLVDAFETDSCFCMVTERMEFGDMRRVLGGMREGRLSERLARKLFAEMVLGVEECHRMGYLVRGVKLGSLRVNGRGHVKIGDLGWAKGMEVEYVGSEGWSEESSGGRGDADWELVGRTTTFVGTRRYMAPEQVKSSGYGSGVDVWALGVVLYVMLVGQYPFGGEEGETYAAICKGTLGVPGYLTSELRELISGMLQTDADRRWDLSAVKACAWMQGIDWSDLKYNAEHDVPQMDVLREFSSNGLTEEADGELVKGGLSSKRGGVGCLENWESAGNAGKGARIPRWGIELAGFGYINYPRDI